MVEAAACLAMAIWGEARGESLQGQIAVGQVVMERVRDRRWPNTVCGVVYQPHQFQGVTRNLHLQTGWHKLRPLAEAIIKGLFVEVAPGANHFVGTKAYKPKWTKRMKISAVIGGHVFYHG